MFLFVVRFQGRTNKLVDGCYSFWQGGAVALLDYVRTGRESEVSHRDSDGRLVLLADDATAVKVGSSGDGLDFDREELQEYVLMCSQQSDGGLRDKPGKSRDFYHTCYTLSGLSVAQHCLTERPLVLGDMSNELKPTNAAFNIAEEKAVQAMKHFDTLPGDHATLMGPRPY